MWDVNDAHDCSVHRLTLNPRRDEADQGAGAVHCEPSGGPGREVLDRPSWPRNLTPNWPSPSAARSRSGLIPRWWTCSPLLMLSSRRVTSSPSRIVEHRVSPNQTKKCPDGRVSPVPRGLFGSVLVDGYLLRRYSIDLWGMTKQRRPATAAGSTARSTSDLAAAGAGMRVLVWSCFEFFANRRPGGHALVTVSAMASPTKRKRRLRASDWPLGFSVVATVALGLTATVVLFFVLTHLVFGTWRPWNVAPRSTTVLDLAKLSLGIVAGIGATQALVVAYRRQRHLETDDSSFVARFGAAAEQIAGTEPALRLAGVYAMAALADQWISQRQQCINVLCAYMRIIPPHSDGSGEVEVRRAIIDLIADRCRTPGQSGWQANHFNLAGAVISTPAHFRNAKFIGSMDLSGAEFSDAAVFSGCEWHRVALFRACVFNGRTRFPHAKFRRDAQFDGARFNDRVSFVNAEFGNHVSFARAEFISVVRFTSAHFRQGARFTSTLFHRTASFREAKFDGDAKFHESEFAGPAYFELIDPGSGGAGLLAGGAFHYPKSVEWGPLTPALTRVRTSSGKPRKMKIPRAETAVGVEDPALSEETDAESDPLL